MYRFATFATLVSVTMATNCDDVDRNGNLHISENVPADGYANCALINTITFDSSVTAIGDWAFYHISGIKQLVVPHSITSIGSQAFEYAGAVDSNDFGFSGGVYIGNGVTSIGVGAFLKAGVALLEYKCKRLTLTNMAEVDGIDVFTSSNIPSDYGNETINGIVFGAPASANLQMEDIPNCYTGGTTALSDDDACPTSLEKCNATGLQNIRLLYNNHPDKQC